MKKLFFWALAAAMLPAAPRVLAVPAYPGAVLRTQSDGAVVAVYVRGDEGVSWLESPDGYTLVNNGALDVVFARRGAGGDLLPTGIVYRGQELERYAAAERDSIGLLPKGLWYSEGQVRLLRQLWAVTGGGAGPAPKATAPVVTPVLGEKHVLCIVANFSDKVLVKSLSEVTNLMNQLGYTANGNAGSVKDFYRANSYGQMDITVTVAGPVDLPHPTYYYGNNNPEGLQQFGKHVALAADPVVDFSQFAQYMQNPNLMGAGPYDYRVPTFHILFAGYGDEAIGNGQQVWSHKWSFTKTTVLPIVGEVTTYDPILLDDVWVGDSYSCSPELRGGSGSTLTSIGVVCHELCHAFGAPDYYDTDYGESGGDYPGTGRWDLMAGGSWGGVSANDGTSPAQINMLQKILFGWVEPTALTAPTSITDMPHSVDSPAAYTIQVHTSGELYVLENRQQLGFDASVPGAGLLIYHVHQKALGGTIGGNTLNVAHPQQMYVVAAGSTHAIPTSSVASYGSVNSATSPFGNAKKEFTATSTPRMFRWDGSSGVEVDLPITSIAQSGTSISFDFMGGVVDAEAPHITAQPQPATYQQGDPATALTVAATSPDGGTLSYRWYSNTANSSTGGTAISGATAAGYTPSTATVGTAHYYAEVTNTNSSVNGAQTATATSSAAAVHTTAATTVCTVTFDPQGGSSTPAQAVERGSFLRPPKAPLNGALAFMGWHKDPEGNQKWSFANDKVTANLTLYAKWGRCE